MSSSANNQAPRPRVDIWADGACKGNPGPGGWGALMRSGVHEKELFGGEALTTNNQMELTAVIRALEALNKKSEVHLHVDSTYVMKGITEWIHSWKKNNWRTAAKKPVKNAELWRELDDLVAEHETHWHWVKGHSGDPGNERADDLANLGVDEVLQSASTGDGAGAGNREQPGSTTSSPNTEDTLL